MKKISFLQLITHLEKILAALVLVVTVVFAFYGFAEMTTLDWSEVDSFIVVLEHVLYIAIGIELARLLLDYSLENLVELLAFVIARKILLIEGNFVNVLLAVVALAVLFFSRHYFPRTFNKQGSDRSVSVDAPTMNDE